VDIFPLRSMCFNTLSIATVNNVADRGSPCLTLISTLKFSVNWLFILTFAIVLVRVIPVSQIILGGNVTLH
jgi:hypothetical protein